MLLLGLNNMHDAAAALLYNGRIIAAAEEERFTRNKHTIGFPVNSINYCLREAGVSMKDIDFVVLSWKPWLLKVRIIQAARAMLHSRKMFKSKMDRGLNQLEHEWLELFTIGSLLKKHFGEGKFKIKYLDHHLCHAASAYYCSPYDSAAIFTVDGAGEEKTTVFWKGEGTSLKEIKAVYLPHSLGQFYSAVTGFLGFKMQSDEYKVMGLSSYGRPSYYDSFRKNVLATLPEGEFRLAPGFIDYHLARQGVFLPSTTDVIGEPRRPGDEISVRHEDIAASLQRVTEETIFHSLNYLYNETEESENLCMAGGVAFNCVVNGKITENTRFKNVYVQPAAGDAGTAMGAALYYYYAHSAKPREYMMRDVYLGPRFTDEYCKEKLNSFGLSFEELTDDALCARVAKELSAGNLVFWFQGRMEWGPRALGNRSLLADPRREDMKDIINLKVKQREAFRPFAPSILEERKSEYFYNGSSSPFMLMAFKVRDEKAREIPAVVHVDGTARPQTVNREENPLYWKLISDFEGITGVPVILNTSFNVQEPIVCSPEESIRCYLKTDVDYLVLNNLLIARREI